MEDSVTDEPFRFEGFSGPNTTAVPDEFFDVLAPLLSEAELRVLLYIIRRTFGFKKGADTISLNQLIHGITTRDGRVLDTGTGMSRQGVMRGLKGLLAKDIIAVNKAVTEDGANQVNLYTLHFREGVVYDVDYGSQRSRPPIVYKVDSQLTVNNKQQNNGYKKYPKKNEAQDDEEQQRRIIASVQKAGGLVRPEDFGGE